MSGLNQPYHTTLYHSITYTPFPHTLLYTVRSVPYKLEEAFRNRMGDAGFKYQKGNPDNYKLLQQYGREDLAKRFAKQLRALHNGTDYAKHKPCTMVDKLVEELEHPEVLLVKKR